MVSIRLLAFTGLILLILAIFGFSPLVQVSIDTTSLKMHGTWWILTKLSFLFAKTSSNRLILMMKGAISNFEKKSHPLPPLSEVNFIELYAILSAQKCGISLNIHEGGPPKSKYCLIPKLMI